MDSQRRSRARLWNAIAAALFLGAAPAGAGQHKHARGPENFGATARVETVGVLATAYLRIHLDGYSKPRDRQTMVDALRTRGYDAFVTALRQAPSVGYLEIRDRRWTVRWASQQPSATGRRVVIVTDQPVMFLGAGSVEAAPREGYQLALVELQIGEAGLGEGTMAPAARIAPCPDGKTVCVDEYADRPVQLKSVVEIIQ